MNQKIENTSLYNTGIATGHSNFYNALNARLQFPSCNITVSKNRIKRSGKNVFLKNGTNFELEFFNPLSLNIKAEIWMNGVRLHNSLVIRPGQRIYLERFLDSNNKFVFNTYEVDTEDQQTKAAIKNNGDIQIFFYKEYTPNYYYTTLLNGNNTFSTNSTYTTTGNINLSNNVTSEYANTHNASFTNIKKETGRIEKGNHSNQSFVNSNETFEYFYFHSEVIKILPFSEKPIEVKELAQYCTECGTKNKKNSWKYCPTCGNKY